MHFVIMGCGRVGSSLAHGLEDQGHSVAIVDRDPAAFRRLGQSFRGRRVTGIGFDRRTLQRAGIEEAHAFAAVSSGDNSNIISARVARETYGVENVVARIYDPGRAELYQRLGIPTVGTVRWTTERIIRRLLPSGAVPQYTDPSGSVVLAEVATHPEWIGRTMAAVETHSRARVAYLARMGQARLPAPDTVLQEGDILVMLSTSADLPAVEAALAQHPPAD